MKIYITGAHGMVGHNICSNDFFKGQTLLIPSSKELDLLDFEATKAFLKENSPDIIIHCAGKVGGIQANQKNMTEFFYFNAVMGLNLVRASFELGLKNFLNLSSSCSYPKDLGRPLKETDCLTASLEPTNEGYALAKVAILKLCSYITKEHEGFLYKTLVPCNLYGKWDKFTKENAHMVPSVIRKLDEAKRTNTKEIAIWGDGKARREFMYAGDLADCVAKAVKDFDMLPTVMNVGLGFDYTVNEYYQIAKEVIGFEGTFTHDLTQPVGMQQKLLDISLQKQWGWQAKTDLKEGIAKTYEYYKQISA